MFVDHIGLNSQTLIQQIIGDNKSRFTRSETPLPYSDDFKQAISGAIKEMRKRTHSFVHSEHILMAITRLPTSKAIRIIEDQNVTVGELRRQTERLFAENPDIFDFDEIPKFPAQMGKSFYDGQPIRFQIQDLVTGNSLVDLTMPVQSFRDMTSNSRLKLWWGVSGEVFKNSFGDYQLTIAVEDTKK
ncbi:MAG: Clp protease N-terminal domain-containing protein [Anaerolineae bacterium]